MMISDVLADRRDGMISIVSYSFEIFLIDLIFLLLNKSKYVDDHKQP